MDKKYKLINKSNRVIGVSVAGMEQVFNIPPEGEEILLDNYYINHLTETIKIFKGDVVLEELSQKDLLDEHTRLSQELQPEFYSGEEISLFNKVTDEGDIIPITEIKVGDTEININKNVDEGLNELYVSLKTDIIKNEDKSELLSLSKEELLDDLKGRFNFEDNEPNLSIVDSIYTELEFSRKNIELLDKLKDFNHDDVSILDADELSETNYPEDEELVGDITVDPNLENIEVDKTIPAKKKGSKKNTPKP